VTFWTAGRLTLDDPNATTADIYGYDAETDELSRLTAPQGGVGGTYACGLNSSQQCYGDNGYDNLEIKQERAPRPILGVATDPLVPGDRLAFFQSKSRLVPEDTDDVMDVYEWRNGTLRLLSTGQSDTPLGAFYKGNDSTGRNVYFVTRDALTWQDTDVVWDVYTARVGGGIAQPVAPVSCALTGACQSDASGATPLPVQPRTTSSAGSPSAGNASPGARTTLRVGNLSGKARRRAARSGVIRLRIRSNKAGRVSAVAKGRVGKRMRRVGRASKELSKPGVTTVRIKLNRVARKQLRRGRKLNLSIQVRSAGARPKSMKVALRRAGR
jgi:hypothetical protein